MNVITKAVRRRIILLIALLVSSVLGCVLFAVKVQREASGKVEKLAHVELEAAALARQFRSAVDDLHGALLRVGTDSAEDSAAVIQGRRQKLSTWLNERRAETISEAERAIVDQIAAETRAYFIKLDALNLQTHGLSDRLDRDTIVMFDDSANRLQSRADDFAAAHDADLRELLQGSLNSLLEMRNFIFGCLSLLVLAIAAVVALLYRDVVGPLQEQLLARETLLAQREKLAALGTLAAGVAHEIRNPLTAVKARLYTLRRTLMTDEAREDVQAIAHEVDRLERIVRDVLGYARPADAALKRIELAAWLREFGAFVAPSVHDAKVDLAIEIAGTAEVKIDANQLRQVMLNLVRNAQEALDGRPGRIALALRPERITRRGHEAEVAVLSVIDDGPGIPAEIQSRLFDPFFTTKQNGTGLGLSIVARLVENQGGRISFQSAPGAGTRFSVHLPLAANDRQTHLS